MRKKRKICQVVNWKWKKNKKKKKNCCFRFYFWLENKRNEKCCYCAHSRIFISIFLFHLIRNIHKTWILYTHKHRKVPKVMTIFPTHKNVFFSALWEFFFFILNVLYLRHLSFLSTFFSIFLHFTYHLNGMRVIQIMEISIWTQIQGINLFGLAFWNVKKWKCCSWMSCINWTLI